MTFDELVEFKKDLKTLLKKYRTLNDDLLVKERPLCKTFLTLYMFI
jgi:hypothetical protein